MYVCVQMKSSLIQTWEVHYLLKHRAVIAEKKTFDKLLLFLIHRTCCFFFTSLPGTESPLCCISAPSVSLIIFLLGTTNISASLCSCSAPKQTGLAHVYFFTQSISCRLNHLLHGRADMIQHNVACLPLCNSLEYSRSSSNWVSCHSEYQSSSVASQCADAARR